jgi:hypothetical protein
MGKTKEEVKGNEKKKGTQSLNAASPYFFFGKSNRSPVKEKDPKPDH